MTLFQTDHSGCATETVSMADFALNKNTYDNSFVVDAELEEHGTGKLAKYFAYHLVTYLT